MMKARARKNNSWIYVVALVIIVLGIIFIFRNSIAFSPKQSTDTSASSNGFKTQVKSIFGFTDDKLDRNEQKVTDAFQKAVVSSGGSK